MDLNAELVSLEGISSNDKQCISSVASLSVKQLLQLPKCQPISKSIEAVDLKKKKNCLKLLNLRCSLSLYHTLFAADIS